MVDDTVFERLLDERNELIRRLKRAENDALENLRLCSQFSNELTRMRGEMDALRLQRGQEEGAYSIQSVIQ